MLKKISLSFLIAVFLFFPAFCFINAEEIIPVAQNVDEIKTQTDLKADAGADKNVVVGKQVLFSGINSSNPSLNPLKYFWDFGDNKKEEGMEVVHIYSKPGVYKAILTVEDFLGKKSIDETIVNVDEFLILLVSDNSASAEKIQELATNASTQKILLVSVRNDTSDPDYVISEELAKQILDSREELKLAGSIILWTKGSVGLNAMLEVAQSFGAGSSAQDKGFGDKNIISITDENFSATARVSQNLFNILQPKYIFLTTQESLQTCVSTVDTTELVESLKRSGLKYQLVGVHSQRNMDKLNPLNFMSMAVNYMVNKGVSLNTIFLILMLPIIATIMAFARQIIGIKAFGIYIPSIIALSFVAIGLKYGLIIFLVIIFTGTLARVIARKLKVLYLPRMAIVLTIVSLCIFLLFFIGTVFEQTGLISVSIFPILIMTFMTEKFIAAQVEQGTKNAIILSVETLILSILCYFVANWKDLQILILGYPELILLTILINILIGRWTGLRILEYFRFRKLINNV